MLEYKDYIYAVYRNRSFSRAAEELHISQPWLSVGSSMFFCTYVLPSLLRDFRSQNPQAAITLVEGNPDDLVQKLLKGELDVILDAEELKDKRITSVPWSREEVILAVPARYSINRELAAHAYTFDGFLKRNLPGGRKPPAALSAFREQPFLLLSPENDMHERSYRLCENAGFTPDVRFQLTQLMTAYYLAIEGQGVTFLRSSIPAGHLTPEVK